MKYDIISVGIMVADVIVDPVNSYPKKGQLLNVDSIKLYSGGNAMTVGINVSKLGLKSALIGMVGNDHFGKFLLSCLDENSIATTGVAVRIFPKTLFCVEVFFNVFVVSVKVMSEITTSSPLIFAISNEV